MPNVVKGTGTLEGFRFVEDKPMSEGEVKAEIAKAEERTIHHRLRDAVSEIMGEPAPIRRTFVKTVVSERDDKRRTGVCHVYREPHRFVEEERARNARRARTGRHVWP